jgi:hypothetical protein
MTTNEGLDLFLRMLTRTRAMELERLKRENGMLRALKVMHESRRESENLSRFQPVKYHGTIPLA